MSIHYPSPAQPQPNGDLPAAGAAALKAYLSTCEEHAIVPDVGGAWASAFRAGADYAAQAMATQAGPATWDLIEQLVQLMCSRERLHMEHIGKAMPADVYLRFQKLRDERIPALQAQLRAELAGPSRVCDSVQTADSCKPRAAVTGAPDQPPADFAHAYADQLMLRCLVPVEPAPQAQPADALEPIRQVVRDYHYALDTRQHGGVAAGTAINAIETVLGMHWQQCQETNRRAAMAAAQEGGRALKTKKVENATDDLSQQLPS